MRRLADGLSAAGKDVWVDVNGIRDAERFPDALRGAIQESDAFVFVISPSSVGSPFCVMEVAHAAELNKRFIPVVLSPVPDDTVPEEVRFINWIPVESADAPPVERIVTAVDADLSWEKQHTNLTVRALRWNGAARDSSMLLRGSELTAAERWLTEGADKEPGPTGLEQEFIFAGRAGTTRRQRVLLGASLSMLVVAVGLLIFALISRGEAVSAKQTDRARELAAYSQAQLAVDPDAAVALGIAAVDSKVLYGPLGSMFALRQALDDSYLRAYTPPIPTNLRCAVPGGVAGDGFLPTLAANPDGQTLSEGLCEQRELRIISSRSGRVERIVHLGGTDTVHVYLSPTQLVIDPDGRLELLDLSTAAIVRRGPRCEGLTAAVDLHGPVVAFAERGDIIEWDLGTGATRRLAVAHSGVSDPTQVAFSPDGTRLAVATLSPSGPAVPAVMELSAVTGHVLAATPVAEANGFPEYYSDGVAFSPDGRELVSADYNASSQVGSVDLLDARSLTLRRTLIRESAFPPNAVAFAPRGGTVGYEFSSAGEGIVSTAGARLSQFLGVSRGSENLIFSPDGRSVANTTGNGAVYSWDAVGLSQTTVRPEGVLPGAASLAPAADGFVLYGGDETGRIFARHYSGTGAQTGPEVVLGHGTFSEIGGLWVSPDGRYAALQFADPTEVARPEPITIWDLATGHRRAVLPATAPQNVNEQFFGAPLFVDGDRKVIFGAAAGATNARVELLTIPSGRMQVLESSNCEPTAQIAADPSGAQVAISTVCGTGTRVYDTATGHRTGPPIHISGNPVIVALGPGGRLVATGDNVGRVTVSDVASGHTIFQIDGAQQQPTALAFSPDGRYLTVGGTQGFTAIYDAHTGVELRQIPAPGDDEILAFSPDGSRLYTLSYDNVANAYSVCPDCENPKALVALARTRAPVPLTADQRAEFGVG